MGIDVRIGKVNRNRMRNMLNQRYREEAWSHNIIALESNLHAPLVRSAIPPSFVWKERKVNELRMSWGYFRKLSDRYASFKYISDFVNTSPEAQISRMPLSDHQELLMLVTKDLQHMIDPEEDESSLKFLQFWIYYALGKYHQDAYLETT